MPADLQVHAMATKGPSPVRINYVLIDFENVQPKALEQLTDDRFKVIVFVGADQDKLPFEVVESLQQLGSRAEYIKISGQAKDALDFHIAYYIGRFTVTEPTACFHIISKDKGYDPLIQHLRSKKIFAGRVNTVADIPFVKKLERVAVVLRMLQKLNGTKPETIETLSSTIASRFQNKLSESEVGELVHILKQQGYLEVAGEKVTYSLPANDLKS